MTHSPRANQHHRETGGDAGVSTEVVFEIKIPQEREIRSSPEGSNCLKVNKFFVTTISLLIIKNICFENHPGFQSATISQL